MNTSFQGEVVLTKSGETQNPINVDIASAIMKGLCCSIGIPLNMSVAVTITRLQCLHRKPRNFFLLGIIFSYLSFFIPPVIELLYWGLFPVESLCHVFVAVVVVPQGLLLMNMLLALVDRYLAINHPLWHREKMTNRLAGGVVIISSISVVFLIKFVYIVRLGTIRCEIWLFHVKTMAIVLMILFPSCAVLNIVIYRRTKGLLRSRTLELTPEERVLSSDSITANNHATVETPMSIHVGRKKLGQMEMEATRTLIIGVASLCVLPCLALVFLATFFTCQLIFGQFACSKFNGIGPYIRDISLTPALYGPIIFLVRNKELRGAWTCLFIR